MTQIINSIVRELVSALKVSGKAYYVAATHSPELGIPASEYWRVTVERVQLGQPYNEDEVAVLCDAGMEG